MYLIIFVIIIFLIMYNTKVRNYIRNNRELVLSIMYTIMSIMFSYVLLRPNNFKIAISYMKKNILYGIYIIIYIAIPLYFIITAIKSYKEYFKVKKSKNKK